MSEKSYVSQEVKICPVCGKKVDTNSLLFHERLREVFDRETVTGWAMCEEHQKLFDEGYTAMIGVDPSKSKGMNLKGVYRTGNVMHVKNSAWPEIFDAPLPDSGICFTEDGVIDMLQGDCQPPTEEGG